MPKKVNAVELVENVQQFSNSKLQSVPLDSELDEHDRKVARRLKWKIDLWTLPMITFIYLLAAMDRSGK